MNEKYKSLKTVLISTFIHEIHIARTKLGSEGIESFIENENLNSIYAMAFIDGYKLNVNSNDYEHAKTILSLYKT